MSLLSTLTTTVTTALLSRALPAQARALVVLLALVCAVACVGAFLALWVDWRGDGPDGAYGVAVALLVTYVVALVLLAAAVSFALAVGAELPLV